MAQPNMNENDAVPLKRKREPSQDRDEEPVGKTSRMDYEKKFEELRQKECDVFFCFQGTTDCIGGHRDLLSEKSPVFAAMFQQNMKEAQTGRVDLKGIRPDVFMELMNHMYSGKLEKPLDEGLAQPLFIAADKYMVDDARKMCLRFMNRSIRAGNVVPIYAFVLSCEFVPCKELADTKRKCRNFICNNAQRTRRYQVGRAWNKVIEKDPNIISSFKSSK